VVSYKFDDVVASLNQVAPYDWARFLRERLDSKSAHAPLGGIENGGWKLIYNEQKNSTMDAAEKSGNALDLSFSLGMIVTKEGEVRDVIPGSPAYTAGLGAGMKVIAVNGRKWSKDVMRAALRAGTRNQQPLAILAENGEYLNTYQVNYHGGEKYPHLVRNDAQPDVLSEIARPLAPPAGK
jgi:predicted metalloprotease with PDZ domain